MSLLKKRGRPTCKYGADPESKTSSKKRNRRALAICGVALAVCFAISGVGAAMDKHDSDVPANESSAVETEAVDDAVEVASTPIEDVKTESAAPADLVVKFVDVGQGDASLIEFPDGKTMLIDTPDGGSSAVTSALRSDGRTTVDWLVATHPDADHIGGLDSVIGSMTVGSVWVPEVNSPTQTYTRFLTAVADKGLGIEPCCAGRRMAAGENYAIDILWPQQAASYSDDNGYSAIIKVTYGESTFLFTGDAPVEAESRSASEHVDVLKVSHHGSASGTDGALARKLSPKIAVISYGKNSYGHPAQTVIDALNSVGAQVLGTYVNGTVTIISNGKDVSASTTREGAVVAASEDAGASSQGISSAGGGGASGQAASVAETPASSSDDSKTVVVTPTGSKYHTPGCRATKRSKSLTEMTKSQAQAWGYTACGVCNP